MKQQAYRTRRVWVQVEVANCKAALSNIVGLEIRDLFLSPSHSLCFLIIYYFICIYFCLFLYWRVNIHKDFSFCSGFEAWGGLVLLGFLFGFFFLVTQMLAKGNGNFTRSVKF